MKEYDKYDDMDLPQLGRAMAKLQTKADDLKERKSAVQRELDFLRYSRIPDKMDEEGIDRITVSRLGTIYTQMGVNASVKAGKKEDAMEWMENSGLGDLVTETINSSALRSLAKRRLEEGKPLPVKLFNVTPFRRAQLTRS